MNRLQAQSQDPVMSGEVRATTWRAAWAALIALALALPGGARAANCSLATAGALAFGTYDPFSTAPLDSVGTITYRCSKGQPVRISLGAGQSGAFAWRHLRSGAEVLRYNLYLDAARSQVWGDGSATTATGPGVVVDTGSADQTYVFGRIPPEQDVAVGVYADTVVVTFDF